MSPACSGRGITLFFGRFAGVIAAAVVEAVAFARPPSMPTRRIRTDPTSRRWPDAAGGLTLIDYVL